MIMYCLHAIIFVTQPYKSWLGEFEKQVSEASNDRKEVSEVFVKFVMLCFTWLLLYHLIFKSHSELFIPMCIGV